jgi:hypothetical protein
MTNLAQSDLEAKEHAERRAVAAEAEVRRLSAEVANLREEADASRAALYDLAAAVRMFEANGGAIPILVKMRRVNAEELLGEKATDPRTCRYDFRTRRARAALAGSPQDERNTKEEDGHA